jgi:hypothetical protein
LLFYLWGLAAALVFCVDCCLFFLALLLVYWLRLGLVALRLFWPFLVLLLVYLRCPCAGRHLLFFACRKEK